MTTAMATKQEQGFLDAIKANPDDDGLRLIYADWLEEHGKLESAERAEFIRVQVEIAATFGFRYRLCRHVPTHFCKVCKALWIKHADCWSLGSLDCEKCCDNEPMEEQIAELSDKAKGLLLREQELFRRNEFWWCAARPVEMPINDCCYWNRGFIESIHCNPGDWYRYADEILSLNPIRKVVLTETMTLHYVTPDDHTIEVRLWPGAVYGLTLSTDNLPAATTALQSRYNRHLLLKMHWPGIQFVLPGDQR